MKQSKKKKKSIEKYTPSRKTINALLIKLESAHNALEEHHNFNLAEATIAEYYQEIPQPLLDKRITKSVLNALRDRDINLLDAAIEAEIERLSVQKIKLLRRKVIG